MSKQVRNNVYCQRQSLRRLLLSAVYALPYRTLARTIVKETTVCGLAHMSTWYSESMAPYDVVSFTCRRAKQRHARL